jgi:hypothetical protein
MSASGRSPAVAATSRSRECARPSCQALLARQTDVQQRAHTKAHTKIVPWQVAWGHGTRAETTLSSWGVMTGISSGVGSGL